MLIVKIGGGEAIDLEALTAELAEIREPMVIVHGANALRDRLAAEWGEPVRRVRSLSGQESVLSDDRAIDLLMLAYAGLRNKRLVELLQRRGCNAIGLSGLDGGLVRARRNPGVKVQQDGRKLLLRDRSGKPVSLNAELLHYFLEHAYVPVITVPLIDEHGCAVNSENDEVVALLARELRAQRVWMFIEAPGLLRSPVDPDSVIGELRGHELADLEGEGYGRMRRKVLALKKLLAESSESKLEIRIADGRAKRPVAGLLSGEGTTIRP